MAQQHSKSQAAIQKVDPVWARIRTEAETVVRSEPEIGTFIYSSILHHDTLEAAVVHRVSERLEPGDFAGLATDLGPHRIDLLDRRLGPGLGLGMLLRHRSPLPAFAAVVLAQVGRCRPNTTALVEYCCNIRWLGWIDNP